MGSTGDCEASADRTRFESLGMADSFGSAALGKLATGPGMNLGASVAWLGGGPDGPRKSVSVGQRPH